MLGLDKIDGAGAGDSRVSSSVLPPARDWSELEERRRTMWSIFCTDLDTSSTTGWPTLLDPKKVSSQDTPQLRWHPGNPGLTDFYLLSDSHSSPCI